MEFTPIIKVANKYNKSLKDIITSAKDGEFSIYYIYQDDFSLYKDGNEELHPLQWEYKEIRVSINEFFLLHEKDLSVLLAKEKPWYLPDFKDFCQQPLKIYPEELFVGPQEKQTTSKARTPGQQQIDRERCRVAAQIILKREPTRTIQSIIDSDEIIHIACSGKDYLEKTIREWINDLWPQEARKGGRPKKTSRLTQ